MKNLSDILFIVQARLNSERVPGKMLRSFGSSNLCEICLTKVALSIIPSKNFYFSVYEEELKEVGKKMGVNIWNRSKESAFSEGKQLTTIYDWHVMSDKYTFVILISACNPFLKVETINEFINFYCQSSYDGLFGVIERKTYFWDHKRQGITNLNNIKIMNTKLVDKIFEASHVLYGSKLSLIKQNKFMGDFTINSPALFIMDESECLDIDYEWQFNYWNAIYSTLYE